MSLVLFSIFVAAIGVLLQFTIYTYLYSTDKKRYLGIWAISWGFGFVRHLFEIIYIRYEYNFIIILLQLASLFSGLLLLWGTYNFLKKKIPLWWLFIGGLDSLWIIISVALNLSFPLMTLLTFVFQGMVYVWTGIVFLRSKQVIGAGKYITGWGFILWGLHKGNYPFIKPIDWLAPWGYLVAFVFGFFTAFGTILVYFVKTRNELKESEERFRLFAENAQDVIYRLQLVPKPHFTYISPSITKMVGYTPEEYYQDPQLLYKLVHSDDKGKMLQLREDFLSGETFFALRWIRKDSRVVWLEERNVPVRDKMNNIIAIEGIVRDVTERKMMEEALLESEERYRQVVDLSPDAIYIQCEGKFVFANPATARMLGFEKPEQLNNRYILDFIHPDFVETAKNGMSRTKQGLSTSFTEAKLLKIDGTPFDVEVVATPFKYNQKPASLVLMREITERKLAEEQLRKLSYAVEQSPSMVMIADIDGNIEYINSRFTKIRGYTLPELIGKNAVLLNNDLVNSDTYLIFLKKIYSGEEWQGEVLAYKKDGSRFWEYTFVSPIINQDGEITHFLKVGEDITGLKQKELELRKAKEEAEAANKAKSQFLANISHELRTPMNGIIGMTDLLLTTEINAEQKEYLELTKSSAESLLYLINDLLDISSVEVGKLRLEMHIFNLTEVIQKIAKIYRLRAHKKGLDLKCFISHDVAGNLVGDSGRLRQVLENLIGNAVKFTEKGSISIKIELDQETMSSVQIMFSVSDTGIGIKPEKMELLFKNFSQIDESDTRKYSGTGLGLAICKQLVEIMGGTIWVESVSGVGSTFSFTVPFLKPHGDTKKYTVQTHNEFPGFIPQNHFDKVSILLVEDHPINQKVVSRLLHKMGWEVMIASNGLTALDILSRNRFDLILMDIQMPEMDGIELTLKIRKQERITGIKTPIIALTAYSVEQEKERCQAAGMDGYLSKPITANMLYTEVVHILYQETKHNQYRDQPQPLDLATTLRIVDGDHELAGELFVDFKKDIPRKMEELVTALKNQEFEKLRRSAHNLRGALTYFGAKEAVRLTAKLEESGLNNQLEQGSIVMEELKTEMERINEFITKMERRG